MKTGRSGKGFGRRPDSEGGGDSGSRVARGQFRGPLAYAISSIRFLFLAIHGCAMSGSFVRQCVLGNHSTRPSVRMYSNFASARFRPCCGPSCSQFCVREAQWAARMSPAAYALDADVAGDVDKPEGHPRRQECTGKESRTRHAEQGPACGRDVSGRGGGGLNKQV